MKFIRSPEPPLLEDALDQHARASPPSPRLPMGRGIPGRGEGRWTLSFHLWCQGWAINRVNVPALAATVNHRHLVEDKGPRDVILYVWSWLNAWRIVSSGFFSSITQTAGRSKHHYVRTPGVRTPHPGPSPRGRGRSDRELVDDQESLFSMLSGSINFTSRTSWRALFRRRVSLRWERVGWCWCRYSRKYRQPAAMNSVTTTKSGLSVRVT